jgi:hypothetical protein
LTIRKRAQQIYLEVAANVVRGDFFQRNWRIDGRAIDKQIQPAETLARRLDQPAYRRFIRQVGLKRLGIHATSGQIVDGFGRVVGGGAIVDGHVVTALGECDGEVTSDAPLAAPCYQCNAMC